MALSLSLTGEPVQKAVKAHFFQQCATEIIQYLFSCKETEPWGQELHYHVKQKACLWTIVTAVEVTLLNMCFMLSKCLQKMLNKLMFCK